jgi:adenylate kinase family enzyme
MKNIKRVAIIGNAGSGKSTLAENLHQSLKLPVHHLDKYFWKPGWSYPDPSEYKLIHDALCDQEEWIIDGNNLRLLEYRMDKAQSIIFLDIPRYLCFWRILKRLYNFYGEVPPGGADGCNERISQKFVKFLQWVWNYENEYRPQIISLLNARSNKKVIHIFNTQNDVNQFIKETAS